MVPTDTVHSRLRNLLKKAALICLLGLGYAFFVRVFHFSISCPIYTITGYYCPGCGISRMAMEILEGNILEAIRYNYGIVAAIPLASVTFSSLLIRYIRTGDAKLHQWQNITVWIMVIELLIFGILRNVPAFSFLAPT